jgi:1,4-dihydroxy-2-naphthoate octaprenyltransferase
MSKIKAYLIELRAPFLTASIISVLVGTAAAKASGANINATEFFLVLAGFVCLHLGANVVNDFFDNAGGTDVVNKEFVFPFTGGSRLIQAGILKPSEVLIEGLVLYLLAGILFLPLVRAHGNLVTCLFLFGLVSGMFYTAPPFKWAHRGLGELMIFLSFGPLIVFTSWYVQTGTVGIVPLIISLPVAFLVTAILDINEFPDFEADRETRKKNLVVRMGRNAARYFYIFLLAGAYISLAAVVLFKYARPAAVIGFIGLPFSVIALAGLMKNYDKPALLGKACVMTILAHVALGLSLAVVIWFAK